MEIITLALRNVFRNTRRTVITLLSIAIGVVSLVLFHGFIHYTLWGLRESTINSGLGHMQITTDEGFFLSGSFDPFTYLIEDYQRVQRRLRAFPEVEDVVPAITFTGNMALGDKTGVVMVNAMPPEAATSLFSFRSIISGRELNTRDKNGVILARGVAQRLGANVGDYVTLQSVMRGGGINAADYEVIGICALASTEQDNIMVYMNLDSAKELLLVSSVPLLVVALEKTEHMDDFYTGATNALRELAGKTTPLTAKKWSEIASYYLQVEEMYANNYRVISVFILLVVVFAIINTMMMTVLERVREIGTLRAMGSKKTRILVMFLAEGGIIGLLGGVVGVLTGLLIAFVINNILGGIYVPPPPGQTEGYQAFITPEIRELIFTTVLAFLASLVGTIFPAIKAIRMRVADSLRFL